ASRLLVEVARGCADDLDVAAHRGRPQLYERSVVYRCLVVELELGAQVTTHRASIDPDVRPLADTHLDVARGGLKLDAARGHGGDPLITGRGLHLHSTTRFLDCHVP